MKVDDSNGEVHHREDATEEYSFDDAAKGLASGTLSRTRALRMAGAALASALLLPLLPKPAQADNFTTRCSRKNGTVCRIGQSKICCPEDSICATVLGGENEGICVKRASIEWDGDCSPSSVGSCPNGKVCASCAAGAAMGRGLCAAPVRPRLREPL